MFVILSIPLPRTLTSSVPTRYEPLSADHHEGVQPLHSSSHHPMAGNPKRKGSGSQAQSAMAKRARWEDNLAMTPSESSPTAALISGVPSAHIHGGSFAVVGSGTVVQNTYHNYGPQTPAMDILAILRNLPLPNFRDIQLDTLSKATDGTCASLTSGEMFLYWISNRGILWGIGIRKSLYTVDTAQMLTDQPSWSREDRPVVSGFDKAPVCNLTSITAPLSFGSYASLKEPSGVAPAFPSSTCDTASRCPFGTFWNRSSSRLSSATMT
jgi:hypothetical protein